jgi:hypothetical protein
LGWLEMVRERESSLLQQSGENGRIWCTGVEGEIHPLLQKSGALESKDFAECSRREESIPCCNNPELKNIGRCFFLAMEGFFGE